jgi:hypothetical protein
MGQEYRRLRHVATACERGWPDHLVVGTRSDRKPHLSRATTKNRHFVREVSRDDRAENKKS